MPKAKIEFVGPYDDDQCYFCPAKLAAYQRPDSKGKLQDCCEKCARAAFPQSDHPKKRAT